MTGLFREPRAARMQVSGDLRLETHNIGVDAHADDLPALHLEDIGFGEVKLTAHRCFRNAVGDRDDRPSNPEFGAETVSVAEE